MQIHDDDLYTPETLAMMCRVLDEVVRIATGNGIVRCEWQEDVRTRLAHVIMNGAAKGVKDPIALRRMALTSVAMGYLDNGALHGGG